MKERKFKKDNIISLDLTGILDVIICLLLFISSIYKGSFYKSDFLFPNVIICLIGAIYLINKIVKEIMSKNEDKKPKSKIKLLLDIFMLLLPFTYLFPIIFKKYVSLNDSIYEMLRYVDMTIIYFIVQYSKNEKAYLNILLVIALTQIIFGIDQVTSRSFEKILNEISTGYLDDTERLSGTIQYANITGTIITLGIIICFSRISDILKKENKSKYIEMLIYILIFLLGTIAISFTKSRVAVIVAYSVFVLDSIFNYIYISKEIGTYKLFLIIYSIIVCGTTEKLALNSNESGIYISSILFTILYVFAAQILKKIYLELRDKLSIGGKYSKTQKYIRLGVILVLTTFCIILVILPKNIVITSPNSGKSVVVTKNIYDFKFGDNKIEFKVKGLEEGSRFTIKIKAVSNGYRDTELGMYNYYDNKSWNFKDTLNVPEDTRRVVIDIVVQKGKIRLEKFKLNNNSQKLSYMFLPDSILSKLKDTFYGVYGDTLRLTYAKDTLKLLKNSPIIGVGGEGFKYTYTTVQESSYISSEAHSALLQALVEVGIVGTTTLLSIIVLNVYISLKLIIRLNKMAEEDKYRVISIILVYFTILSTVIFDLAFSYAFVIYAFAICVGLLLKAYIDIVLKDNGQNGKLSAIDWSYIKIIILSLSLVTLAYATYFSFNAYRASLITVPNKGNDLTATEVSENIAYLELKTSQDKFDIDYMKELNTEYNKYKIMITEALVNVNADKNVKEELIEEQNKLIISIKNNTDKMLEYSYYDKYVLKEVADIYISNYIKFAEIYKEQFSSSEVAYTFYLNYALKLADRILELNPYSKKANEMYKAMCKDYLKTLKKDNKYLNSKSVEKIVLEIEAKNKL